MEVYSPDLPSPSALTSPTPLNTGEEQRLRKRRLGMSFSSYTMTFALVFFCWLEALIPGQVVAQFAGFSVLLNGFFFLLIQSGINLRLSDPSMTQAQMALSLLPALWVMFFLEAGQARAAFLMIAMVPSLYGILALRMGGFLVVGLWFFFFYGLLYLGFYIYKPQVLTGTLDVIQTLAFVLVMAQITVIGGFISGLRGQLRHRNKELNAAMGRIQELVNIDELTGVCNRRRIFEVLAEEYNRYTRTPGAFSVCILDVDNFKQVNDRYGHQSGDDILRKVAASVTTSIRTIDCFGRYGGEEFLLILPQTPADGAMIKAERVRQAIASIPFPDINGEFRVTVSIGVAEYEADETVDDTIARADRALYRAKEAGRNRVELSIGLSNEALDTTIEPEKARE
ncbi:GGDEF domain-containing protein [Marinobacter caseinilyticus]|uniref:GGDEF domain-containing protein n=1 Tax=Marinobacter caseinilyticus TaxID=2692195 RepID=UPI00140E80DF|nr:diguanylate cyclase [Marinobacter caseinilyticus]